MPHADLAGDPATLWPSLGQLAHLLADQLDPMAILQHTAQTLGRLGRWRSVTLALAEAGGTPGPTLGVDQAGARLSSPDPADLALLAQACRSGGLQQIGPADPGGPRLAAPIVFAGEVLGALGLAHPQGGAFAPGEIAFARAAADIAALALHSAWCADEIRRATEARDRVEWDLHEMLLNFENAEEQAGLGSWTFDVRTGAGWWSKQMCRLFGRAPDAGVPSIDAYMELIHPEDRELIQQTFAHLFSGMPPKPRDFRTNPERCHPRILSPQYRVVTDAAGAIRKFIGTVLDVTALKQAQLDLLELNRTLEERVRERTAEVQDLYEHAPTGYHSLDADGIFLMVNQTELSWLGYTREEVIGRPFRDFITPQSYAVFEQGYPLFRSSGWVRDREYDLVRKDGSTFPVLLSATAIYDRHGVFVMSRSTLFDITERKRSENALKQAELTLRLANLEMVRALRMKDEFLANMSHELRTPLNAILAFSESMLDDLYGPLSPAQRESVGYIESSGRHLLAMINDILDLSKVEAGRLEIHPEPVLIADVCQASLHFVRELALKKHLQLELALGEEHIEMQADPRRLKQILVNLLSNAVKFTPPEGRVSLTVDLEHEAQLIHFAVRDTGIGIASEHIPRLFQPFTQLDSSLTRQHDGSGLGLALVQRLAELHGGRVTVESMPSSGSCFTITLPYHPPAPSGDPLRYAGLPVADDLLRSALVVDDSAGTVDQLRRYLGELQIDVVAFAQGGGTLDLAAEIQPSVIFLDLLLPDQSGWDVLALLKADPRTSVIPVVIISVMDDRERGLRSGAAAYLVKPVARDALQRALRLAVAESPAGQQALVVAPLSSPRSAGARIMLAEDNEVNIRAIGGYLEAHGYEVLIAHNGREALDLAGSVPIALILMDIQMPEMDGLEAIRHLRARAEHAATPIVALTALVMPGDRERCLAAGASEYLSKPLNLRGLVATIERLLHPAP